MGWHAVQSLHTPMSFLDDTMDLVYHHEICFPNVRAVSSTLEIDHEMRLVVRPRCTLDILGIYGHWNLVNICKRKSTVSRSRRSFSIPGHCRWVHLIGKYKANITWYVTFGEEKKQIKHWKWQIHETRIYLHGFAGACSIFPDCTVCIVNTQTGNIRKN